MSHEEEKVLSAEERHEIIVSKLKEFGKKTRVFDMRWTKGDLITEKILKQTPAFWYMRFAWTRKDIEDLFFAAQVYIDEGLDNALDAVFGPLDAKNKRPRWIPREIREKLGLIDKSNKYQTHLQNVKIEAPEGLFDQSDMAWSKFAGDKDEIDFNMFLATIKNGNIDISPELARKIFENFAKDGYMDRQVLNSLLQTLDSLNLNPFLIDIKDFKISDLNDALNLQLLSKLVMLNALDMPLPGSTFTNMLLTRDAAWEDRLRLMQNIISNLGTNPLYQDLLQTDQHFSDLVMGWLAQMLDSKVEVSRFALENLPQLFASNPIVAMRHLRDIVDAIFSILNNIKHMQNHETARTTLTQIIDYIVENLRAQDSLYLSSLLAAYADTEQCVDPKARGFALYCIKRVLMKHNADKMDRNAMPQLPAPQAEFLNIACRRQDGPSARLMTQGPDETSKKAVEIENDAIKNALVSGDMEQKNDVSAVKMNEVNQGDASGLMKSEEIGTEFVSVVMEAIETALMDPNKLNKENAARLLQLLNEMAGKDNNLVNLLDGESKNRYYQWKAQSKGLNKQKPSKPLPEVPALKPGSSHHDVSHKFQVSMKKPTLPDI